MPEIKVEDKDVFRVAASAAPANPDLGLLHNLPGCAGIGVVVTGITLAVHPLVCSTLAPPEIAD